MYSAVVAEECDVLALSWEHLLEVERVQRAAEQEQISKFLRTVPVFHGISFSELSALALHAKKAKTVGSKVVCSEGQFVDGIFIVREGEICQLSPSELRLSPDLSIAFNLCGSFAVQTYEQEKTGLEFFTQMEFAGDPLAFVHLSNVVHGFLPHDFIDRKLQQLEKMANPKPTDQVQDGEAKSIGPELPLPVRKKTLIAGHARRVTALALQRGGFFFASSSWIPPRKSRQASTEALGVACAKSALISRSSSDLLFFSSADLIASLVPASRNMLQRNAQTYTKGGAVATQDRRRGGATLLNARLNLSKQPTHEDMLEQLVWTKSWTKYKDKLVQAILQDKKTNKPRNCFQTPRCEP